MLVERNLDLYSLLNNKRVALVGPSPHLIDCTMGSLIDEYDVVCRVNDVISREYAADYGAKNDIIFHACPTLWIDNFADKLAKDLDPLVFTKSGIMVGLGETIEEIESLLVDLRKSIVDFVTIGQYMQPTKGHLPVVKYLSPKDFEFLEKIAYKMGFLLVSSSPLTRSSYHADDDFKKLKISRNISLNG